VLQNLSGFRIYQADTRHFKFLRSNTIGQIVYATFGCKGNVQQIIFASSKKDQNNNVLLDFVLNLIHIVIALTFALFRNF
jgi:hypothetical protein